MVYTPAMDGLEATPPVMNDLHNPLDDAGLLAPLPRRAPAASTMLRFGGLTLNTTNGAITWRGHALVLAADERELLHTLMRRAGQIVSSERLAATLGLDVATLDKRMVALRTTLKRYGSSALPCSVNGLGYILWRC